MEFFYQPRLAGIANLDLNVGAVSRGEMTISTETESSYGTATIYPIGLGVRLAPFAGSTRWAVQPILRLGGTVLIGTEQFEGAVSTPAGTFIGTSTQSRWALGFYGGAGLAWLVGDRIALTVSVKYQYARFGQEVFGSKDYSGIQVLVGAMYLYLSDIHRGFTR
jgi:opacity protein-like surface antigen